MDPRLCDVDFCPRIAPESSVTHWTCDTHRGVNDSGLEFEVVTVDGEEGYLYSGVEYIVTARTVRIATTFTGVFAFAKGWRLRFDRPGGEFVEVAADAITAVQAT